MEQVVKDKGGTWVFDGDRTYYCINQKGKKVGKIYAEFLPDPASLWREKCKQAGAVAGSLKESQLKPTQVIYKLWEHKNANIHA